uniref:ATP synthase subunit a n=1 Tax=Paraconotrochus antarcticus TaxID=2666516 RepID=A0A7T1W6L4_9CNID
MMFITGVGLLLLKGRRVIPLRWQSILEIICGHFYSMTIENLGKKGLQNYPFILSLFFFIFFLNSFGLFPYVFTPTAHIVITFGLSFSIILGVTLAGFWRFKKEFFSLFMPAGAPLGLAFLLVLIETVSYFSRAISLGVRLAANLSAGHLLFVILAGFAFSALISGGLIGAGLLGIMALITLLEIAVAIIQAYVFCLLTVIYLGDVVALH